MLKISSSAKIYVSLSKIPNADRGVFASIDIKKGETIETCPFIEIPQHELPSIEASILVTFVYYFGATKERALIALGLGSIYNHSYTPNAQYRFRPRDRVIEFVAINNIPKDSEITVDYIPNEDKSLPLWFEK